MTAALYPLPRWFTAEKPAGQFSRRHQTIAANEAARERYKAQRGPAARRRRAAERNQGASS